MCCGMLIYRIPLHTKQSAIVIGSQYFVHKNPPNIMQLQVVIPKRQPDKTVSVLMLESDKWPLFPQGLEGKASC